MTPPEWASQRDARQLIRFCAQRIPRQHLGLVFCELAQNAVPHWHARYPDHWAPAWCIATLRAWCLFQASDTELERASSAAQAGADWNREDPAACAAAECVTAAAAAALW